MPSTENALILSTVPSGFSDDGKSRLLTVHVSPQFADVADGSALGSWTTDVLNGKVQFQLAVQASTSIPAIPVQPNPVLLKEGLWRILFGDLSAALRPGAKAANSKMRPTISNSGVQLRDVLNSAQNFYQTYVKKFDLSDPSEVNRLISAGIDIADRHSIYARPGNLDSVSARAYLKNPTTAPGKNLTVTRIFGNVSVDAAFPVPSTSTIPAAVNLRKSVTDELQNIHSNSSMGTTTKPQHIIHHIHRIKSVSRTSPAHIASSSLPQNVAQPTIMNLSQRISLLQNMPALLEGLGLILEFPIPPSFDITTVTLLRIVMVQSKYNGFTPHSPWTYLDTKLFLPLPAPSLSDNSNRNPKIAANGYVDVSAKGEYRVASLQPESASSHIYNFANHTALRFNAESDRPRAQAVTKQVDEDYTHAILPHSPHTAGLYVYQHGRQAKVKNKLDAIPGSNPNWDQMKLYAEDLFQSYAVDVLQEGGSWTPLTVRNEEYFDLTAGNKPILTSRNRQHGVRTSATRPTDAIPQDPASTDPSAQMHVVDETLFTWRYGSLAILQSSGKSLRQQSKEQLSNQIIPWDKRVRGVYSLPAKISIPNQRFGMASDFTLRPIYLTGRARPLDAAAANSSLVPRDTKFLRNELVLGPQLVRRKGKGSASETQSLMYVASTINNPQNDDSPTTAKYTASSFIEKSVRYLVPAATTQAVAGRHGMSDMSGANTIPLKENAAVPDALPFDGKQDKITPYIPDPMCDGVRADLYFVGNKKIAGIVSCSAKYYPSGHAWPNYALHCVELQRGKPGSKPKLECVKADLPFQLENPFTTGDTRIFRCTLPPGMTLVMELIPTILDSERNNHVFSPNKNKASKDQPPSLEDSNVCRPTILRMTHATDIPLIIPNTALQGAKFPTDQTPQPFDRKANPAPTVDIKYEPYTTSKIAMEASWTDQVDDLSQPQPDSQALKGIFYQSHLPKVTASTDLNKPIALAETQPSVAATIPFSDARYRRVTMATSSVSRYVGVFPNAGNMPTRKSIYDFLATAPPPVPDVEYLIPTYEWSFAKNSNTRKCGIAVMLNRPWYASGDSEQLAVILPPGNGKLSPPQMPSWYPDTTGIAPTQGIENQVSAWGTHAIWASAEDRDMHIDLQCAAGSKPITLPNSSTVIAAFDPTFDDVESRWCCNLSFTSPPVYGVLMRLALARYQPHSISSISPISGLVFTDFAFLSPTRMLTVAKKAIGSLEVTITGIGSPGGTPDNFDVRMATEYDKNFTTFNYFEADPAQPTGPFSPGVLWHGFVKFDWNATNTLVVREYETHNVFEVPSSGTDQKMSRKLVYATAIDLTLL